MTNFYVYFHRRKSDGSIFYVGKGSGNRAWWEYGRSEYWNRVKNKHGLTVDIYACCLTEEEAHSLETVMIAKIGRHNLCNHTDGGEGMSGWVASKETREKISRKRTGARHTEESKAKMSNYRRGRPKSPEHVANQADSLRGRKFSKDHRANLSKSLKARVFDPAWGKKSGEARTLKVFCENNGKIYNGTREAGKELGLDSGSISRVANGKYKHTKGYVFRYE